MMNNIDKKIQRLQEQLNDVEEKVAHQCFMGYTPLAEEIVKLHDKLDELKKEAENQSNKFTEFKEGDYFTYKREDGSVDVGRINSLSDSGFSGTNINSQNTWCGTLYFLKEDCYKAVPAQIEQALRSEWDRRCKEAGWESGDEAEIEAHADDYADMINLGTYKMSYYPINDFMTNKNGIVYSEGKWATPKTKKADRFFEWEVRDQVNPFGDKDLMAIGCQTVDKQFLFQLKDALKYVSEKSVKEVIEELDKLDL